MYVTLPLKDWVEIYCVIHRAKKWEQASLKIEQECNLQGEMVTLEAPTPSVQALGRAVGGRIGEALLHKVLATTAPDW